MPLARADTKNLCLGCGQDIWLDTEGVWVDTVLPDDMQVAHLCDKPSPGSGRRHTPRHYVVLPEDAPLERGDVSECRACRERIVWFAHGQAYWEVEREDNPAYCPLNTPARTHLPGAVLRPRGV